MNKNCILYLIRSSEKDVEDFNKSINLAEQNLLAYAPGTDVIVFHEKSFEDFKPLVRTNVPIIYQLIEFKLPKYAKYILDNIPEYYPHPNANDVGHSAYGTLGFSMGYRFMCRFFSGAMYNESILDNYEYYLRLDTDSFILSPLNYDLFKWAEEKGCWYGYIEPGVQLDHPKVVEKLWDNAGAWANDFTLRPINSFLERTMYYTNFELGRVQWFKKSPYMSFFNYLDKVGGFFLKRWGDAPVKFLGINLLMPSEYIVPVHGFIYQHGATYDLR